LVHFGCYAQDCVVRVPALVVVVQEREGQRKPDQGLL
jgi:hypothetical protein